MREKPQRKRPNKKTAGRSEARQENKPDRRKEAAGEAIEDNFVFGYHAVAEALKEGRGNKGRKNRSFERNGAGTGSSSQMGAKTKAGYDE